MATSTRSPIEIHRVDPLAHSVALKALFAAHERADFADYFDRAYPDAVREGAQSWIGVEQAGEVVMHVARFPQRFHVAGRTAVGGLLVNLMTARPHRTFFPTLALLRRLIADSRAEGGVDFLYGDPNDAARPLVERAGMNHIGNLERFVLPLRDTRWYANAAIRGYHWAVAARGWNGRATIAVHAAAEFDAGEFEHPNPMSSTINPFRPPSLFRRRLADYPNRNDLWFTVRAKRWTRAAAAVRAVPDGSALLCALQRDPHMPLSSIIPPLTRQLRGGYDKLWLWTMNGTCFADELRRTGFIQRREGLPVFGVAFTELGDVALRSTATWETTHLDFDR